jgi:hypothetical protein
MPTRQYAPKMRRRCPDERALRRDVAARHRAPDAAEVRSLHHRLADAKLVPLHEGNFDLDT